MSLNSLKKLLPTSTPISPQSFLSKPFALPFLRNVSVPKLHVTVPKVVVTVPKLDVTVPKIDVRLSVIMCCGFLTTSGASLRFYSDSLKCVSAGKWKPSNKR